MQHKMFCSSSFYKRSSIELILWHTNESPPAIRKIQLSACSRQVLEPWLHHGQVQYWGVFFLDTVFMLIVHLVLRGAGWDWLNAYLDS